MLKRSLFLIFLVMVLMCGSASADTIPADYTSYFNFNEGTGNTAYNSNTSNPDMTLFGSQSQLWTYSDEVHFNGTSYGYIAHDTSNDIDGNEPFTFVAVFNPDDSGISIVFSKYFQYQFRLLSDVPTFTLWNSSLTSTDYQGTAVSTATNHTAVVTGDGSTVRLLIDDVEVANGSYPVGGIRTTTGEAVQFGRASTNTQPVILDEFYTYEYEVPNASVFYNPVDGGEPEPGSGNSYYVNNSHPLASDSNDGSESSPWLTIQHGITQLSSGDSLYVDGSGDTYNERLQYYSTITGNNTRLIGINGQPHVLWTAQGTLEFGYYNLPTRAVSGIVIDNMWLDNNGTSSTKCPVLFNFNSGGGSNITIINSTLTSDSGAGVYFNAQSNVTGTTIQNCTITTDGTVDAHGITFADNHYCSDNNVIDNTITCTGNGINYDTSLYENNNTAHGNIITAEASGIIVAAMTTPETGDSSGWNITNNYINAGQGGTQGSGIFVQSGNGGIIANNIVNEAYYTGIKFSWATNFDVYNNTVNKNGYGHNAFETKGVFMNFYDNYLNGGNYSHGSADSFYAYDAAGTQTEHHVTIRDSAANDAIGGIITTGGHQYQVIVANITGNIESETNIVRIYTVDVGGSAQTIQSCANITIDNVSVYVNDTLELNEYPYIIHSVGTSLAENKTDYANNTRDTLNFIDLPQLGTYSDDNWWYHVVTHDYSNGDIYRINVENVSTRFNMGVSGTHTTVFHDMYYANIKVVDNNGSAIEGASLTFSANVTNPETSTTLKPHNVDYGDINKSRTDELDIAYTNSNGLTDNRFSNASNTVALTAGMQYYTTSEQYQAVEWNVTATFNGTLNSTIITPDMLRYSPDSADIQSDLVTIVLGVDTTEEKQTSAVSFVAVVFTGLSFVGLHFANRFRRR